MLVVNRILALRTLQADSDFLFGLANFVIFPKSLETRRQHLHPQDAHTPNLMEDFIDNGLAEPMAVVYENDYLYAAITGAINPSDVVMIYPTPDIISDDTLVSWDPAGNRLVESLTSSGMDQLAERDGYRTDGDSAGFVGAMAALDYTVPDILDPQAGPQFISNHASPDVLQGLTGQVMPGH